jgi:hypothetical protein
MQKKSWIFICFIGITLTISLLLYGKAKKPDEGCENYDAVCCDTDTPQCREVQKLNVPGEMIIENLTRQFLIIPPF